MPTERARFLPLLLVATLLGCGDSAPPLPKTPHGGTILPTPEQKGSAEFVKKAVEGQGDQAKFIVYFVGPDDKPMAAPPTAATFKPAGRGAKPVEFKPSGAGDSSLTSDPFPNEMVIEGELSMTLDGKPTKMPVRVR